MRLRIIMPRRLSNESTTVKGLDRTARRFGLAGQGFLQARPECFLPSFHVSMSQEKCRWGILGSAGIAQKNWQSIRNAGNAELVAVASRDVGRAQDFIDRCSARVPHPTTQGHRELR